MRAILPLTILLALAMPVQAHDCATWRTSVTDDRTLVIDMQSDLALGVRYVVNDLCNLPHYNPEGEGIGISFGHDFARIPAPVDEPTCLFSIWYYFETNGIPGLQRSDEVRDDTCHGLIDGDTILF